MYGIASTSGRPQQYMDVVACRSLSELRLLIHEGEVVTGAAGREFFVSPNVAAALRIAENPAGFDVLLPRAEAPRFFSVDTLIESGIGKAMAEGRLFTKDV